MPVAKPPDIFDGFPPRIRDLLTNASEALPILQQSCRSILDRTDDAASSASDVSDVVMKDQALMAKIIKMANSSAYHTVSTVATPTHAVTIIGFDVIRSIVIAAQLVEQAEERGGSASDLKHLLARALVAATEASELGEAIGYEKGNLFTSAMLYTLGDLILAHYLPDIYQQLEHARSNDPARVPDLEKELLGQPLYRLAVTIAKQWHLPQDIIQLMETQPSFSGKRLTRSGEQLEGLVSCANALGRCLLNPPTPSTQSTFKGLMEKIPTSFNLSPQKVETLTMRAFEKAFQFADAVKIEKNFFVPDRAWALPGTDSPYQNLFKGIWKAAGAVEVDESREDNVDREGPPPPAPLASSTAAASQAMLAFLQDFTLKALTTSDLSQILNLATEGLFSAAKYERVVLTLFSPASGMLEPRVCYGDQVQTLLPLFRCPVKDRHLLAASLKGGEPVKVESLRAEMNAGRVPPEFIQQWGEGPCLLGPLSAKSRPVGVIVVDRGITGQPITEADYATFVMVIAQVNANLTRLASTESVRQ